MPDIGLLQGGAPRPRKPLDTSPAPIPAAAPGFQSAIQVAAHHGVVSSDDRPVAMLTAPGPAATADSQTSRPPREAGISGPPVPDPIRARDLLWLLLALIVIVGTGLGVREPWPADEPRFVSLARDMAQSGEWLFPRVGGDLYQDKPPLFFWLLAVCYTLFGWFKGWFLIPSLMAAGGILFLVYDFGRRVAGRNAAMAAAVLTLCTLQFVLAARAAQIDATLCLLTTLSLYALLRYLLLGHGWRWYFLGGFAAGLGVFTKGVGFLPLLLLIPFFLLRGFGWKGLATIDAGRAGWRWWLAPLGMLCAVSLWFLPMLVAVAASHTPDYVAYRDEILFKQTVGRYAAAWHHVKPWYYFIVEVMPAMWMPWSLLLFWLVPRYKAAFQARDARVWLPLGWVLVVVLFFSLSPGKRGIYILPALPALAIASLPVLGQVLARPGARRAGFALAAVFWMAGLVYAIGHAVGAGFASKTLAAAGLANPTPLYAYLVLCGAGVGVAMWRAPLLAWPAALGSLTVVFSFFIAPAMNGERSGGDFMRATLKQVKPDEELGLVSYKEQFLLYLDRPAVNFGHRRWLEGPQESFDAAAWLNAEPGRVLLVPERQLKPCFEQRATNVGSSSDDEWFLVRPPALAECAARGQVSRAIGYPSRGK
jgi:4-amino-4-deoxy-L-arabinose transferase-like glycosyltransferase